MKRKITAIFAAAVFIAPFCLPSSGYASAPEPPHEEYEYVLLEDIFREMEEEVEEAVQHDGVFSFIHTPEGMDSVVAAWYAENVSNNFDQYFREFIDLDSTDAVESDTPDSVYAARLKMIVSPINMGFNDVIRKHIIAYTSTRKGTMARILGLSQVYFPMIEEELAANDLPLELRMLPVIESALNPTAVSRMGATGLWQFMYGTGKSYGLEITSYVDMRRDPVASTKAACRFLKDLYNMYNDWSLAIAAYNCGPGNVNKALRRAGASATTFWDIYDYLPRETRGYIPAFVAATYAYTFYQYHDIEPVPPLLPISTDTVHVDRLMHLEQIASTIGTDMETLRHLNPQYKMDIVPALENKVYPVKLPQSDIARYISSEQEIFAKDTVYLAQYQKKDPKSNAREFQVTATEYRVKKGDTLGAIARQHGVTVNQLVQWNNLKSAHKLSVGQRLQIHR